MLQDEQTKPSVASMLPGKRVVIVEDEGMMQLQLHRVLTREGLIVVGDAPDGRTGVEVVLHERPDLVLMDVKMPGDMNGLDAAEAILMTYHVCIVILTAYAIEKYIQRARDIGTCGYLVKPITADTLIPQLEAAYRQWKQQSAP